MFVDVSMLVDTVAIRKQTGETDRYDKPTYTETMTLERVRFDKHQSKTGTANNKEEQNTSILFVYPRYALNVPVFDKSWLNGIVTYRGDDYIIKGVNPYPQAFSNKIFSYEIEVI
ncbi:putative minor capsid protein [Leuconostoc pseudomesenteroides]|uniref:putative minor capsid protein n=1 Tax=Leuconostoc pseudomesenteroides TaxID=33968 RepID=UPI00403DA1DD